MGTVIIIIVLCIYRFMGYSILTILDYETWKPRRQLYDPAFKKRFATFNSVVRMYSSDDNFFLLCSRDPSYLKTLLKPFNEITNEFLDELKPLADGETKVPMKTHLGEFSLDVISKVAILVQCANTFHVDLIMLFLLAMDLYIPYI